MSAMASQITSLMIVYSTVYSGTDQRSHQSSAPLAFVRGIHRWPVNSPYKGPVTRKMFPFDDVIMCHQVNCIKSNDHATSLPERPQCEMYTKTLKWPNGNRVTLPPPWFVRLMADFVSYTGLTGYFLCQWRQRGCTGQLVSRLKWICVNFNTCVNFKLYSISDDIYICCINSDALHKETLNDPECSHNKNHTMFVKDGL